MKEGRERPEWLKVVQGGRADERPVKKREPSTPKSALDDIPEHTGSGELVYDPRKDNEGQMGESYAAKDAAGKEKELMQLYLKLYHNPPLDFERNFTEETVQDAAKMVRKWEVDDLYEHFSGDEVWKWPAVTKAAFDEIQARILNRKMGPRE